MGHSTQQLEQEDALDGLIQKAKELKAETISNLLEARKEIERLNRLYPMYPRSEQIPARLQICDQLLERGNKTLTDINSKLLEYEAQKTRLIAERETTDISTGPGF